MQNHHVNQIASERSIVLLLMLSFLYFMSSNHGWRVLCEEALQMTPIALVHFSVNRRNHHQYQGTKTLIGTSNEQRCELFWESNYMSREKKSKHWSSYNNLLQNHPTTKKMLSTVQPTKSMLLKAWCISTKYIKSIYFVWIRLIVCRNSEQRCMYMQSFQFLEVFNSKKLKWKKKSFTVMWNCLNAKTSFDSPENWKFTLCRVK